MAPDDGGSAASSGVDPGLMTQTVLDGGDVTTTVISGGTLVSSSTTIAADDQPTPLSAPIAPAGAAPPGPDVPAVDLTVSSGDSDVSS